MKQDEMIMVPFVIHEGDMAREERKQARLWILLMFQTIGAILCLKVLLAQKTSK